MCRTVRLAPCPSPGCRERGLSTGPLRTACSRKRQFSAQNKLQNVTRKVYGAVLQKNSSFGEAAVNACTQHTAAQSIKRTKKGMLELLDSKARIGNSSYWRLTLKGFPAHWIFSSCRISPWLGGTDCFRESSSFIPRAQATLRRAVPSKLDLEFARIRAP